MPEQRVWQERKRSAVQHGVIGWWCGGCTFAPPAGCAIAWHLPTQGNVVVQVDPVVEAVQQAITEHAEDLLRQLALPDGFYRHLLDEDDWSFISKLNVLF